MPAVGDYLGTICQRVFDLLVAEPAWTGDNRSAGKIYPAARLSRLDSTKRWATLAPVRKVPVIIWDFRIVRGIPQPGVPRQGQTLTFDTAKGGTGPLILSKQYTLVHTLTHPDLVQTYATLLETVLELVLVRAKSKLALNGNELSYCNGCLPVTSNYNENNKAGPNGSPALVQTLTHPIGVVVTSADILGT